MEKLRVVFKRYGKLLKARGSGVVLSAEDVVGALVKADGPITVSYTHLTLPTKA